MIFKQQQMTGNSAPQKVCSCRVRLLHALRKGLFSQGLSEFDTITDQSAFPPAHVMRRVGCRSEWDIIPSRGHIQGWRGPNTSSTKCSLAV